MPGAYFEKQRAYQAAQCGVSGAGARLSPAQASP